MKIVVFGPDKRTGALLDDNVVDLSYAYAKLIDERDGTMRAIEVAQAHVPSDLMRLVEAGSGGLEKAQEAIEYLNFYAADKNDPRGEPLINSASNLLFHAPHPRGARVACAGSNFLTHRQRMTVRGGRAQEDPFLWGFWNIEREFLRPDGDMIYPARCEQLDYEGEVAIIIGQKGKDILARDLADYVWGVTLAVDWSIRGPHERLGPMNFAPGKNFDTSMSLGPCIVAGELDAEDIEFETVVNGEQRQLGNTSEMVFSYGDYLEYISRDMTVYPGDMIVSGTPAGTVADSTPISDDGSQPDEPFLQIGDEVEVRSAAVGNLRARITAKG